MPILTPTQIQNGISQDLFNVSNKFGVGVYQSPIYVFNCTAQSYDTPSLQIVALNNAQANVPMPFYAQNVKNIEGIPVPVIPLDCQRGIAIDSLNYFTTTGSITFTGYDRNKIQVVNTVDFNDTMDFVQSTKTFKYISSVVSSVDINQISCFPNYLIGLPYYLPRLSYVFTCMVNQTNYAFSNITPGNNWRLTPPSATTGDSNGTVELDGVGTYPLTVCFRVYGGDSFLQAQLLTDQANGETNSSAQAIIFANESANPIVNVPFLIPFDEIGVQYPGNMPQYNKLGSRS